MKYLVILVLIVFGLILFSGCLSSQPDSSSLQGQEKVSNQNQKTSDSIPSRTQAPEPAGGITAVTEQTVTPVKSTTPQVSDAGAIKKAADMGGFISTSLPKVTELYVGIKKARNALDWNAVQEKALTMQVLIQDITREYQLDLPHPEKKVYPDLDSREQIVFQKYVQFLDDMESYASNLKNAVYYQEKGGDPQSAQTARRYQGQADQFEKMAIAEMKTISDYCNDFSYSFLDQKLVKEYRYVG